MNVFYPVTHIKNANFSGKLLIDGDIQDNCILFRFLFDEEEMVHPLIISIQVLPIALPKNYLKADCIQEKKTYIYACNIPDFNNPLMKTRLIFPEFLLKEQRIQVVCIESQISVCCTSVSN